MYRCSKNSVEWLLQIGLLAAIFSAGFFGYIMQTTDWLRAIPGDLIDARFNSVILEHLYQWIRGEASELWSPAFFILSRMCSLLVIIILDQAGPIFYSGLRDCNANMPI